MGQDGFSSISFITTLLFHLNLPHCLLEKPKAIGGVWPTIKPFVNGGASGMLATCVTQPIDMIKVCRLSLYPL
ncbi:putative mitochondrial carrier domain superfamily [Helianthus anomalus]